MAANWDIKGKVCVVTGGASGIGEAVARAFAAGGARGVVIADMNAEKLATVAADWRVSSEPLSVESLPGASLLGNSLLNGRRIVELKFRDVLPASFRGLIQDLRLAPSSFSKYRESVAACIPMSRLTGECD